MSYASIPTEFWDDIFLSVAFLINRLPSSSSPSPFTTLFKKDPDYASLRVLGCLCFPHTRPYNTHKLQLRALPCVFLGYASHQKSYRCLHLPTKKINISRHVQFVETTFPFSEPTMPKSGPANTSASSLLLGFITPTYPSPFHPARPASPAQSAHTTPIAQTALSQSPAQPNFSSSQGPSDIPITQLPLGLPASSTPPSHDLSPATHSAHLMVTRTIDHTRKPLTYPNHVAFNVTVETEPSTFSQAHQHHCWQQAMHTEIDALTSNQTWTLVPPSATQKVIGCKWVYKVKRKADGSIERYKARLVAKGFHQSEGIDFFETFSPVVRPTTIRLVLSIAITSHWSIRQLDVQNAFLHGDLAEQVYMVQPPGFIDPQHPNHVCLLSKAIYGLKQSSRAWFDKLKMVLLKIGFYASQHDPSLFISNSHGHITLILVYVDDIIITGNNHDYLTSCISLLSSEFPLKDLGDLHYFLGIEVARSATGMHLSQTKYLKDLLTRSNMQHSKPASSPMASDSTLSIHDHPKFEDPHLFRSVVGALQYATLTRPDISFAVNKVSQFMQTPSISHWVAVKRILRYLLGTITHGLFLSSASSLSLHAYSDADWAGSIDDRRSTSGFCIFLGRNLISWSAKKQATVSRSSTESEYRGLAIACTELLWLRYLLHELNFSQTTPSTLWCDNIGATFLASNPMFHAQTKHVKIDYHFVRERIASKELLVRFLCSADQIADIMTKPLPSPRFAALRSKLTVTSALPACGGILE